MNLYYQIEQQGHGKFNQKIILHSSIAFTKIKIIRHLPVFFSNVQRNVSYADAKIAFGT